MNQSALLTDYYQLTMANGYWQLGLHEQEAVYHLFFRRNPVGGEYVMASGLQTVIDFLEGFEFTAEDIHYLEKQNQTLFSKPFLNYLKTLRFTGDIDAVPEGSVVFANEPLLRIRAPLLLCQLLETPLINALNFSSAVSTMASRIRHSASKESLFEFGLRRAQGPDGGMTASRAAFIGGFDGTSNVLAGKEFGIPVVGTMSHAWIMAFDDELTAFREYARLMPSKVVLLVDTYQTMSGVDNAIIVAHELKKRGELLKGIRLDSGDLIALSKKSREKLDKAGLFDTKIYVSGDLCEERIDDLKSNNAPIDGFGVGTYLSTSYEQPALDMVYKLGAIQKNNTWQYKLKCSDNRIKTSDPGILQVKRFYDEKKWLRDVIYDEVQGLTESVSKASTDLLVPVFRAGKKVVSNVAVSVARDYGLSQVKAFYASKGIGYTAQRDPRLQALKKSIMEKMQNASK